MKYTLDKFKWFEYVDKRALQFETSDPDFDIAFQQGDHFGYRKVGTKHYLVHEDDVKFQVHVRAVDLSRLVTNSKGWNGKVKRVAVKSGKGGHDMAASKDPNVYILDINSSNLQRVYYYKKEKELEVEFKNGDVWRYEEVTLALAKKLEAAESQGSFFHYNIKQAKPQYKV